MHWKRSLFFALMSFVASLLGAFLSPDTLLHRAVSFSLCGLLSFNSICNTSLGQSVLAQSKCDNERKYYVVYINGIKTTSTKYKDEVNLVNQLLSSAGIPTSVRKFTYNDSGWSLGVGDIAESSIQSFLKITNTPDGKKLIQNVKKALIEDEKYYQKLNKESDCKCKIPRPKYLLISESQGNFFAEQIASELPKEVAERTSILSISSFTDYSKAKGKIKNIDYLLRPDDIAAVLNGVFAIKNVGSPNLPAFPTPLYLAQQPNDLTVSVLRFIGRKLGLLGIPLSELGLALKRSGVPYQQAIDAHLVFNYLGSLETPSMAKMLNPVTKLYI